MAGVMRGKQQHNTWRCTQCVQQPRRRRVQGGGRRERGKRTHGVHARAPPSSSSSSSSSSTSGFVGEMRRVAMRLHSPEQLGKKKKKEQQQAAEAEAEADAAATKSNGTQTKAAEEEKQEQQQQRRFAPTLQGYTRFLRESKLVYDFLEQTVRDKERYAAFRESGLERGGRLALDIASLEKRLRAQTDEGGGEEMKKDEEEGLHAGAEYVKYLESLERESEAKFLCHYYNVYFAHTAGGRMIGNAVSKALLEGDTLQFYCYGDAEGEEASSKETIQPMLDVVREEINAIAEGWSEKEKEECLQETELSFKYSGQLLRLISTS